MGDRHDVQQVRANGDLEALFTPFSLGSLALRNRFAMAPMTRVFRHAVYPAMMSPLIVADRRRRESASS